MSEGKKYVIDLFDVKGFEQLEKDLEGLEEALQSQDFMDFLANKCKLELDKIMSKSLRTENYETNYRESNHYESKPEQVRIYNDSMVDLSQVSEQTLANYPEGLSLAKLIEFGTGIPRDR